MSAIREHDSGMKVNTGFVMKPDRFQADPGIAFGLRPDIGKAGGRWTTLEGTLVTVSAADRARKESLRRQKLLAAQAKPTATEAGEVNALVIGIGPGLCSVDIEGVRFAMFAATSL